MVDGIILGVIQGIVEWLPVSSEAVIVLARMYLSEAPVELSESIEYALFLHLGTFLAALVYFWSDVRDILIDTIYYTQAGETERRTVRFLFVATLISGFLGMGLLQLISGLEEQYKFTGSAVTFLIGVLLLITALMQFLAPEEGLKSPDSLNLLDGLLLGVAQGLAAMPGISRSGITVSTLLLRRYRDQQALRLSFLLSLPIVLGGNIILNYEALYLDLNLAISLGCSFVFGLLTIHGLLTLARSIRFEYFVLLFGGLTIVAALFQVAV
ncbi:MAG: undecaprenyl-diphosphate phosphatase [bacterium]